MIFKQTVVSLQDLNYNVKYRKSKTDVQSKDLGSFKFWVSMDIFSSVRNVFKNNQNNQNFNIIFHACFGYGPGP